MQIASDIIYTACQNMTQLAYWTILAALAAFNEKILFKTYMPSKCQTPPQKSPSIIEHILRI
jgi:hypothetical protein